MAKKILKFAITAFSIVLAGATPAQAEMITLECSSTNITGSQSRRIFQVDTVDKTVLLYDVEPIYKPEEMHQVRLSDRALSFQEKVISGGRIEGYNRYLINRYSMAISIEAYYRTSPYDSYKINEFFGTCKKGDLPKKRF
jgi:hypothetical protein